MPNPATSGCLQDNLDVCLGHRLHRIPVDDVGGFEVEEVHDGGSWEFDDGSGARSEWRDCQNLLAQHTCRCSGLQAVASG